MDMEAIHQPYMKFTITMHVRRDVAIHPKGTEMKRMFTIQASRAVSCS